MTEAMPTEQQLPYYKNNVKLPLYERTDGLKSYSVSDLLDVLIHESSVEGKACRTTPTNESTTVHL